MKKIGEYKIKAELWIYPGKAGWHFITISEKQSKDITKIFGQLKRGWGSLPVQVIIGKTIWETSIFPDKKRGGYLLPIKAEVRKKEKLKAGDQLILNLKILATFD
jgi:hypothetical protein